MQLNIATIYKSNQMLLVIYVQWLNNSSTWDMLQMLPKHKLILNKKALRYNIQTANIYLQFGKTADMNGMYKQFFYW